MHIQKTYTVEKILVKVAALVLMTWAVTFLISLMIATLYLRHIPVYGVDDDPGSMDNWILDAVQMVNIFSMLFSFVALPAWVYLNFDLLIKKERFKRTDILLQLGAMLSLLLYFLFKNLWTSQFAWHFD